MKINKLSINEIICLSLTSLLILISLLCDTLVVVSIFSIIISVWFFKKRKLNLFDSFTVFTAYYSTIIIVALYYNYKGFNETVFITETNFNCSLPNLFFLSVWFYTVGWLCAYLGNRLFVSKREFNLKFNTKTSNNFIVFLIVIFSSLGIYNFIWNVVYFSNGNLLNYFANISIRYYEFKEAGTTIGYLMLELACYLVCYLSLKQKKRFSTLAYVFIVITFLIRLSTGRIFQSLTILTTFASIFYLSNNKTSKTKNFNFFLFALFIGFIGILIYFFRITSSLNFNGLTSLGWVPQIIEFFKLETILKFAIDKANMPSIPVFMKIIDSWGKDIGYLHGDSLFNWIYSILPKFIRPEIEYPSMLIKRIWYPDIQGGNLPPTGVGEMYANFGVFGPFIGMFAFGVLTALMWNLLVKMQNYWMLVIYSKVTMSFILIYAKCEFSNLSLWDIVPIIALYILIKTGSFILSFNKYSVK